MSLPPRIAMIVEEVAEKHWLDPEEVTGFNSRHDCARARGEAYQRIRDEIRICGRKPTLCRIGAWFSGRDHTTVRHGLMMHAREAALVEG